MVIYHLLLTTLPETNSSPLKIGRAPKGNVLIFQPSIFRCELLVSGRLISSDNHISHWVHQGCLLHAPCPIILLTMVIDHLQVLGWSSKQPAGTWNNSARDSWPSARSSSLVERSNATATDAFFDNRSVDLLGCPVGLMNRNLMMGWWKIYEWWSWWSNESIHETLFD